MEPGAVEQIKLTQLSWAACSLVLSLPLSLPCAAAHHTRTRHHEKWGRGGPPIVHQLNWASAAALHMQSFKHTQK